MFSYNQRHQTNLSPMTILGTLIDAGYQTTTRRVFKTVSAHRRVVDRYPHVQSKITLPVNCPMAIFNVLQVLSCQPNVTET